MSTIGYFIVAVSLVLFVQAKNVYPQLLLGRLLFCLGGSAVATMVTALLPAITANHDISKCPAPGVAARLVCTPDAANTGNHEPSRVTGQERSASSAPRLAGYVGMFTGCGALIALLLFLPLPVRFQKAGYSPAQAIKFSFYTVGLVALVISVVCFFGLRGLQGDEGKSLKLLLGFTKRDQISRAEEQLPARSGNSAYTSPRSYLAQLFVALKAGLTDYNIALAYIGGFVARSSSVGISLFIPLYVNQYYRRSGLCQAGKPSTVQLLSPNPGDIKQSCPRAYVIASILTGVSQLVALLCAPLFGYLSDKSRRYNLPLLMGALLGTLSYAMLGVLPGPRISGSWSSAAIFVDMAFIGISQISAIVCSLAILSNGINGILPVTDDVDHETRDNVPEDSVTADNTDRSLETINESTALVSGNNMYTASPQKTLIHVKGSIAGMYSLWGGAGILILTKVGGIMFDKLSPHSPFYILAGFNGLLLIMGLMIGLRQHWSKGRCH